MRFVFVLAAFLVAISAKAWANQAPPLPEKQFTSSAQRQAVAAYVEQFEAHRRAYVAYEADAEAYWQTIVDKRVARRRKAAQGAEVTLNDYVLKQPPAFDGPPEPELPAFLPRSSSSGKKRRAGSWLPIVKDFRRYARASFNFGPERPEREIDYKRAYARTALEAGIGKDQAVRIYGFEASGNGKYDVQAGRENGKGRPISTALGYNQLLVANTIGLVSKYGDEILKELEERAKTVEDSRRALMRRKITKFGRMVRYARSMPYRWSHHVKASRTARGRALHALILDIDIGPLLQTQKLVNSIRYAKRRGYSKRLSAAELEMLNLTGDGNGYDMVSMPHSMREQVPTANFFQRGGYERNPVAQRNNTVAKLIAATDRKMDYHSALDGAKEMAAAFDELLAREQANGTGSTYGAVR